jgi:hypothetical protein
MGTDQLPDLPHTEIQLLQEEINGLRSELQGITDRTSAFESKLAAGITDYIIEEQELTLLYKQQKKAKKDQRNEQKKRGKNYRSPMETLPIAPKAPTLHVGEQREKKRLYREAMLFVHPDKFSLQMDKLDLATEVTTKLIEIYRSGDLETMRAFHAHIFNGNTLLAPFSQPERTSRSGLDYLVLERDKLITDLELAKNKYTYKILSTYEDPMLFLEELKAYYQDRIYKLKKRTRTGARL